MPLIKAEAVKSERIALEWVEQHHPHWAAAHGIDNADDNGPGRHGKGHAYGHDKEHGHGHGKD